MIPLQSTNARQAVPSMALERLLEAHSRMENSGISSSTFQQRLIPSLTSQGGPSLVFVRFG